MVVTEREIFGSTLPAWRTERALAALRGEPQEFDSVETSPDGREATWLMNYLPDIHGTEVLWLKFLNAPKHYKARVLVMGGDVTGKMVIPLVGGAFTLMGMKNNVTIVSAAIMSVMIAISSYLATATEPVRLVAWFFLFIVALNAMAWLILLPLRDRIRELEERCGV